MLFVLTPELVDELGAVFKYMIVSEELQLPQVLPSPHGEQQANKGERGVNIAVEATVACDHEQVTNESEQQANNYERVKAYLGMHPQMTDPALADALTINISTANA